MRSRVTSATGALFALSCLSIPAAAQVVVPKQIEIGEFGACLFKQAPRESTRLLSTALGSPEERSLARTLAQDHAGCIRGPVISGMSGALRGAVAQAALLHDPALLKALAQRTAVPASRPPKAGGRRFVIEYAQCLVTSAPVPTIAFLKSPYSSDAERSAFLAYGDALKACMPVGEEYQVDIPDLRNQVAAIAWQAARSSLREPSHA